MHAYMLPAAFALFVWWFSTGAIIFLDNLPRQTFKWSMAGASFVFFFCLMGIAKTAHTTTITGAYEAFFYGLFAWGWQEISFYTGYVTGPRSEPCREGCGGWRHFIHAIQTSLWHELAIIGSAAIVIYLTWGAENQIGLWTFMVLWWMHQSAKLNVFFGVRNLNEEFLPAHLTFLKSFLRSKPMNLFFPVSITISMVIATMLFERAAAATTPFACAGDMFLATMMALAILEHWFLVVPLPAGKLWQWGLASRKTQKSFDAEIIAGFLGAGKTTFLQRRLADCASLPGKTIVLVNDFASVGIDGSLLANQGADVVELPNGCICCSLRDDLSRQLTETVTRFAPERILIEPSGVADIASLIGVMQRPTLQPLIKSLTITTIIDAGAFLKDYTTHPTHFAAQARLATNIIINKSDLIPTAERLAVAETLRRLNPATTILTARYGHIDATPVEITLVHDQETRTEAGHAHNEPHEHQHDHAMHDLGFSSWHTDLHHAFDAELLKTLLDSITHGTYGNIARVKGLAKSGAGWLHFDVAGGHTSMAAHAASATETARVIAIGKNINEPALSAAFQACTSKRAA